MIQTLDYQRDSQTFFIKTGKNTEGVFLLFHQYYKSQLTPKNIKSLFDNLNVKKGSIFAVSLYCWVFLSQQRKKYDKISHIYATHWQQST